MMILLFVAVVVVFFIADQSTKKQANPKHYNKYL